MLLFLVQVMFLFGHSMAISSHDIKCFVHPPPEVEEIPKTEVIYRRNEIRHVRLFNEGVNVICSEEIEEIQLFEQFNGFKLPSLTQYKCLSCKNANQYANETARQYFFVPWKTSLRYFLQNAKCMESMESLNDIVFGRGCYHLYSTEVLAGCKIIK